MDLETLVRSATADPRREPPACTTHWRKSSTGKRRPVAIATPAMKEIQNGLLAYLEQLFARWYPDARQWATGYFKGCSPFKNARAHQGGRYFYCFDLVSAFGSARGERVAQALAVDPELSHGEPIPFGSDSPEAERRLGIREFVRRFCCDQGGGLVQGLAASPWLFNLALAEVDRKAGAFCAQNGWVYTRFGDDITVSGQKPVDKQARRVLRSFFIEEGFRINHGPGKSSVLDIRRGPVLITKVIVAGNGTMMTRAGVIRRLGQRLKRAAPIARRDEYLMSLLRQTHPARKKRPDSEQHIFDLYARRRSSNSQGAG